MTTTFWRAAAARAAPIPAGRALRASAAVQALFVLSVLLLFAVSGGLLWDVGFNYEGLTGNPATKVHPGTYLVVLAFGLAALQSGNPVRFAVAASAARPASFVLFACAAFVLALTVYRSGPGMAGLVDTYMLPGLVSVLFMTSEARTRDRLEVVVHAVLIANAVLGLVEFGTRTLVFPYRFDGAVFPTDTRSTALQGHPLANATVTAVYILALLGGGGTLSAPLRAGVVCLEAMALVTFGGRSAIVTVGVLGAFWAVARFFATLRGGRVNLLAAAAVVLLATLAPLLVLGLEAGGFFDALLTRFASDGGSANARVEMLTLIRQIPLRDLVLGPDQGLVESLRRVNGLEEGIENPIVRTALYQGILVTLLLLAAVVAYLWEVARSCRRGVMLTVIGFAIVVNTFESLASKTTMLAKFALLLLALFRPEPEGRAGGPWRSP